MDKFIDSDDDRWWVCSRAEMDTLQLALFCYEVQLKKLNEQGLHGVAVGELSRARHLLSMLQSMSQVRMSSAAPECGLPTLLGHCTKPKGHPKGECADLDKVASNG